MAVVGTGGAPRRGGGVVGTGSSEALPVAAAIPGGVPVRSVGRGPGGDARRNSFHFAASSSTGTPDDSFAPETTSNSWSAAFSFGANAKPRASKWAAAAAEGPTYTVRPLGESRMRRSSFSKSACRGWWMTAQTATPYEARRPSAAESSSAAVESRPEVGSSRKMSDGSATTSSPMLTRLRWPPERPRRVASPTTEWRCCVSPRRSITVRTQPSSCARGTSRGSRIWAENRSSSSTVRAVSITSSCGTKATSFEICETLSRAPLMRSEPPDGVSLPESSPSSVDLPQPDGPMIAVTSHGRTSPDASESTRVPSRSLYESPSNERRTRSESSCTTRIASRRPSISFSCASARVVTPASSLDTRRFSRATRRRASARPATSAPLHAATGSAARSTSVLSRPQ